MGKLGIFNKNKPKTDTYHDNKMSRNAFSEQLKILQTKLEQIPTGKGCRKIAITSSIPGEGKTMLAANLASQLARRGGAKVLLVDADIRKPAITDYFDIKPVPGIAEYLMGKVGIEGILQSAGIENLHVIPGGKYENTPDLLVSGKFEKFLELVAGKYDYVIVDTPPIIPIADAVYISKYLDGIIFVYRLDFTPYDMLRKSIEDIGKEKILGVALNFMKYSKKNSNMLYNYGNVYYNIKGYNHSSSLLVMDKKEKV